MAIGIARWWPARALSIVETNSDTLALDVPGGITSFDLDGLYIVVDFGSESVAYPVQELQARGAINDVVADGRPVR